MLATLFLVNTRGGSHKSDPWERPWITNQGNSNRLNDSVCMHVCSGVCRGRWRVRHVSAFFLFCTLASLLPATSWDGKEPRISPWSHTLLYGSASQCTFSHQQALISSCFRDQDSEFQANNCFFFNAPFVSPGQRLN